MNAADEPSGRALVGGRERREIVIVRYDPAWPARFERERAWVRRALGASALRIEHIGSTAVPGLAAKPIVDMLVTVGEIEGDEATVPALQTAGYELRVVEPGHRMLRTPGLDVHLHVWADADPEVERHLAFRDRLRVSAADRAAYERLKWRLAEREWRDMNEYAQAKSQTIRSILGHAHPAPPGGQAA